MVRVLSEMVGLPVNLESAFTPEFRGTLLAAEDYRSLGGAAELEIKIMYGMSKHDYSHYQYRNDRIAIDCNQQMPMLSIVNVQLLMLQCELKDVFLMLPTLIQLFTAYATNQYPSQPTVPNFYWIYQ